METAVYFSISLLLSVITSKTIMTFKIIVNYKYIHR